MSNVLVLTGGPVVTGGTEPPAEILPSLSLLPHQVRVAPPVAASAAVSPPPDAVLLDARRELMQAKRLLRTLRDSGFAVPVLVVVTEGGWAAVGADWGADDIVLNNAGPGEVDARIRLAVGRAAGAAAEPSAEIRSGELVISEATYSARIDGRALDLTFKEFELLKFLTQQPGRVFSRAQLLQEVWGYDYFGGTRTVDVHVRRLRAKLGAENESLIGTVRNVGYRFVPTKSGQGRPADGADDDGADGDSADGDSADGDSTDGDSADGDSADGDSAARHSLSQHDPAPRDPAQRDPAQRDLAQRSLENWNEAGVVHADR